MESKITTQTRMSNGEMGFVFYLEGGIDGLHTKIEADDEIVEVQAQAHTVADGHILQQAPHRTLRLALSNSSAQIGGAVGLSFLSKQSLDQGLLACGFSELNELLCHCSSGILRQWG